MIHLQRIALLLQVATLSVILERDATLQTHLFEDRVMKMSTLHLHPRTQLGSWALALCYRYSINIGIRCEKICAFCSIVIAL